MALIWGQLAVLQAWLLPGLAITLRRSELPRVDRLFLAPPLSAVINYLLIEALTLAHAYNRVALVVIIVVELSIIVWTALHPRRAAIIIQAPLATPVSVTDGVVAGVVLYALIQLLVAVRAHATGVFTDFDAVVSWNRWAEDWFSGRFPRRTWHYPQLLPATISIPYVALQDARIQQFGKLSTAVVPLLMFCTGIRLAAFSGAYRNVVAIGVALAMLLFADLLGPDLPFGGTADVPVAYMVLASCYAFMLFSQVEERTARTKLLIIAALVFAGALLTKQSAMLALGIPVVWTMLLRPPASPTRAAWRELALTLLIVAIVAGHWYVYKELNIRSGADDSEIPYVTSIVQLPWTAKLVRGWSTVTLGMPLVAGALLLAATSDRIGRWILALGVVPAFVVWALFYGYDARNFAVGIVPLAFTLVLGFFRVVRWARVMALGAAQRQRGRRRAVAVAALVVFIALQALAGRRYTHARLVDNATRSKMDLGDKELNRFLYATLPSLPAGQLVGTAYQYMSKLPGLEDRYHYVPCASSGEFAAKLQLETVHYFLWTPERCNDEVARLVGAAAAADALRPVGEARGRVLYQIIGRDRVVSLYNARRDSVGRMP